MANSNNKRDLEALIAAIEKNRIQMQRVWQKAEHLDAAIESAKAAQKKAKTRYADHKSK